MFTFIGSVHLAILTHHHHHNNKIHNKTDNNKLTIIDTNS